MTKKRKIVCKFDRALELSQEIVLSGHQGRLDFVKVLPGDKIISGSWDGVREWSVADQSGKILRENKDDLSHIALLPDGKIALGVWADSTIRIWNLTKKEGEDGYSQTLSGHTKNVTGFGQLSDGRIISGSLDGTIRVWDTTKDESEPGFMTAYLGTEHLLRNIIVADRDKILFSDWDKRTRVIDLKDESIQLIKKAGGSYKLADGTVLVGGSSGKCRIFDFSKDIAENEIKMWKAHTTMIPLATQLPDGRIVTACDDRTIRLWDFDKPGTDDYVKTYKGHTNFILALLPISNDYVISGSEDFTVRLWDLTGEKSKKKSVTTFKGHKGWIRCLGALSDGRIVSGSDDKTVRIWPTVHYFKEKVLKTQSKKDYEIDGPGVFEILFPE